ncbi:MAG TPA: hypothetical protein VFA54_16045 [Bryobacterales bacterium]|nr:hypothetical protein [Bryobacterales bacterium]
MKWLLCAAAARLLQQFGLPNGAALTAGIDSPVTVAGARTSSFSRVPVMLVSYTRALKIWLYRIRDGTTPRGMILWSRTAPV